ncbi:MAG: hypothetical protein M1814_000737 [Vezdaea aestivalis]|nr:MAG: hypothetical protein M1814_000737 [Vezdaea aestivalis]
MPRSIPWLTTAQQKAQRRPPPKSQSRIIKTDAQDDDTESEVEGDDMKGTKAINGRLGAIGRENARNPSSSPPLIVHPLAPPEQEYMKEGINEDDVHMMVDDEFEAVAKLFTAHSHDTAYRRIRLEHQEQRRTSIDPPARPTSNKSEMSNASKLRRERETLGRKQKAQLSQLGITTVNEDTDSDEDLWVGTSLGPMMQTANKQSLGSLEKLAPVKANTKAANGLSNTLRENEESMLGFESEREFFLGKKVEEDATTTDESSDDDDLDAPIEIPRDRPLQVQIKPEPRNWTAKRLGASPDLISPVETNTKIPFTTSQRSFASKSFTRQGSIPASQFSGSIVSNLSSIPPPPKISQYSSSLQSASSLRGSSQRSQKTASSASAKKVAATQNETDSDDNFPKPTKLAEASLRRLKRPLGDDITRNDGKKKTKAVHDVPLFLC